MRAPHPIAAELADTAAAVLAQLRAQAPRVHCITNAVAQTFTANVLLAVGAVPSMTMAPEEVGEFAARADVLLVNLGTFDRERRAAAEIAIERAAAAGRPWVLDPVFVERSPPRAAFARALLQKRPAAVRLNAAEFACLYQAEPTDEALARAARDLGGVIALTGATDRLSDGARLLRITNGDPLMARVTAMGCAGAAFSAACLAVEGDRFKAAAAALLAFAVAGEVAGARARGPGSLAVEIVDALYARPRHLARASEGDMTKVDVRLNAILDPERAGGHDLAELARLVAEGGATLVQLRDKQSDTRVMIERARAIKAALAPFKVPLVINDRVDVALVAEADGVHVGQTDMPVEDARRLLPPGAIIGLSINSVERAQAAPIELLDYVGIGGVYATTSKTTKNAPIGIAGLARIANAFHMRAPLFPLCAIAGIDAGNAADTIVAGADGVAVISALSLAADPRAATRELRKVVDTALGRRVRA